MRHGHIRKVGVVGAGTMGAAIAALAASAGVPAVLLDVPGDEGQGDRNDPARRGLERALKARPAAFMDPARASLIELGNTEDDLGKLAGCDWVVEAIVEQPRPKQELFARLEGILKPGTIVSSNTSGLPMSLLTEGRSPEFRRNFLGTHFFNPPRYLHLLELIPTEQTDPAALETIERFGRRVLGKGTVLARDVPGFIGNRLGIYGLIQAIRLMERFNLTIDEVDALTGPLIGRPRSAVFRTADLSGLDVLGHVSRELSAATGEDFSLPAWVGALIEQGSLGEKSGKGFYTRQGSDIFTLDWKTGEYRPRAEFRLAEIGAIKDQPLEERLPAMFFGLPGKYGDFMRHLFLTSAHYTLEKTPAVAYDIVSVDHALEWGFGWEMGPFRQFDVVGLERLRQGLDDLGLSQPELLRRAGDSFYGQDGATKTHLTIGGERAPVPDLPGAISLRAQREAGKVLKTSKDASIIDLGDGVVLLEFHSKMNTLGEGTLRMLDSALKLVESEGYLGLVIGNEDPRTFSAGANAALILMLAQEGAWDDLDLAIRQFQRAISSIRRAPFPVVVAPAGLALGGGAELMLHADQVRAHAELYAGLVEVGIGLIPAGGGTKELLFRFTGELEPYVEADPFEALRRAFLLVGMAQTSTSALEARRFGFLRDRDRITMNRDLLLADAKADVLALAPDYVAPALRRIKTYGKELLGNLRYAVWSMREGGQISDHDALIGEELAQVLTGGGGSPRIVSEQDILDLERESFLRLAGTRKTQERIAHMLKTGKPLRN